MVRLVQRLGERDRLISAASDSMRENRPRFLGIVDKQLKVDEEERSVTMMISREVVDRDLELVKVRGIDLTEFRKNPIVLFMHDTHAPIGKAESITVRKRGGRQEMIGKVIFAKTDLAEEVFQLVKGDFLRGASLSLNHRNLVIRDVTPADIRKDPELATARRIIEKGELLEFSVVSIPANQDALTSAVEKGLVNATRPYLEPLLRRARTVDLLPKRFVERVASGDACRIVERVGRSRKDAEKLVRRAIAYRAGRI